MKKNVLGKRGITLVELIVAAAIVAVVIGAAYTALMTGIKTFNVNVDNSQSQAGLRAAMLQISKEERKATAVTPGAASLTLTVDSAKTYAVSDHQLYYGGTMIATDIKAISSSVSGKVLTVTLTASDGTVLSTQMHIQ